jgi:hypothetical protein
MDNRVCNWNLGVASKDRDMQSNGWTISPRPVLRHNQVPALWIVSSGNSKGTGRRFEDRLISHSRDRAWNRRLRRNLRHRQRRGSDGRRRGCCKRRQIAGENCQAKQRNQRPIFAEIHAWRTRLCPELFLTASRSFNLGFLLLPISGSVTSGCHSLSSGVCAGLVLNTSPTLVRRAACSSGSAGPRLRPPRPPSCRGAGSRAATGRRCRASTRPV